MSNIFISYRRSDSLATAGRIRDRLVQKYGRNHVFVDVDDIPHGRDFVKVLRGKVDECSVLLAIIGPSWIGSRDGNDHRKLDDPDDFVGIEIKSALSRETIAVIPVLVDGARMPVSDELPEQLKALARRNAIELRNTQFGSDAERLIRSIDAALSEVRTFPWGKTAAAIACLAAVGVVGWSYLMPLGSARTDGGDSTQTLIRPVINAAQSNSAKQEISEGLARLQQALKPAEGRVDVRIAGGDRIAVGKDVVFEVTARTAGRLLLIDFNAGGEVTQIFPNSFVSSDLVDRVPANRTITVPGLDYGFTAFRATEPVGKGVLIALLQPASFATNRLSLSREQIVKGFQPVTAPGSYLTQLIGHVIAGMADKSVGAPSDWAFERIEYEIVR